jgi:predicted RNase H-like nuclease (RuvC/YqgF family)
MCNKRNRSDSCSPILSIETNICENNEDSMMEYEQDCKQVCISFKRLKVEHSPVQNSKTKNQSKEINKLDKIVIEQKKKISLLNNKVTMLNKNIETLKNELEELKLNYSQHNQNQKRIIQSLKNTINEYTVEKNDLSYIS